MTQGETIVFLKDVLGWSYRMIGRALQLSHEGVRKIYFKERPKFNLDDVLEILKD